MMEKQVQEAIVLLGHGSRVAGAGQNMEKVARKLAEQSGKRVVTAYMSRLGPHFPETLANLVEEDIRRVMVIPYFLNDGLHIVLDIPEMMQEEAAKYPGVELVLGQNLGFDNTLVDLVQKRIKESSSASDIREIKLPPREHFPVPKGQGVFVEMPPDQAERFVNEG